MAQLGQLCHRLLAAPNGVSNYMKMARKLYHESGEDESMWNGAAMSVIVRVIIGHVDRLCRQSMMTGRLMVGRHVHLMLEVRRQRRRRLGGCQRRRPFQHKRVHRAFKQRLNDAEAEHLTICTNTTSARYCLFGRHGSFMWHFKKIRGPYKHQICGRNTVQRCLKPTTPSCSTRHITAYYVGTAVLSGI